MKIRPGARNVSASRGRAADFGRGAGSAHRDRLREPRFDIPALLVATLEEGDEKNQ
jgi:hypothetical protein